MSADASELHAFVAELGEVTPKVAAKVPGVVKRGANNIKQTMAADFSRSRSFGQIGPTVNYDVRMDSDGVEAEIGPDKRRRAARLANIAYFGGANGGGGTVRDPDHALEAESSRFMKALSDLLGDVL